MKITRKLFLLFLFNFYSFYANAGEVGIYLPGISYHIGANDSNPAFEDAPRGLDNNGAFVFNPGIGLSYDFRDQDKNHRFSAVALGMFFQDCNDRTAYVAGVGPRYRYFLNDIIFFDADLLFSVYSAQEWVSSEYNMSFVPFASLGINYSFNETMSIGIKTTFSPKNESHSSTAGLDLLFNYLYIKFSL